MPLVLILGLGNFGYAILKHLDRYKSADYTIAAFDRNPEVMEKLRKSGRHARIKPRHRISSKIVLPTSLEEIFPKVDILILAVTAASVTEVMSNLNVLRSVKKKLVIINTAKALAPKTGERLETIIKKHFLQPFSYVYLAGGTIAEDLFNSYPLGATIASENLQSLRVTEKLLASPNFRLYPTKDVAGTEYCAAFKNVVSIFAGIISGLGWPYGSETYFISRFSREVEQFVIKELKGRPTTFGMDSQCWGNDLWMSCTGNTRNRQLGYLIGKGKSVSKAIVKMKKEKKAVEGLTTINVLPKLSPHLNNYPFLNLMYQIIIKGKPVEETIQRLIEDKVF
jgi:glycerol-3-phosphate dehydrogenase